MRSRLVVAEISFDGGKCWGRGVDVMVVSTHPDGCFQDISRGFGEALCDSSDDGLMMKYKWRIESNIFYRAMH